MAGRIRESDRERKPLVQSVIDFVRRYYNKDYPEAVAFLLNHGGGQIIHSFSAEEKPKVLEPPKPNSDMRRAYAYLLLNRCIDREVLNAFIHNKMIYEDEEYHNAVFVGYDTKGKPRHYHKRGKVNLDTTTSEERCQQARSREMCRAACQNTVFTGTASQTKSFCLRHPLICCRLFLCTKIIGMNTAMRHPVPFRTGCFFNASRIILTSKPCFCALITIVGDSRLISE